MRAAAILGLLVGCSDQSPEEEYKALDAKVSIQCGTLTNTCGGCTYLCGAEPDISCINDALAGTQVAKLVRSDVRRFEADPNINGNMYLHHYFAVDGAIVSIAHSTVFAKVTGQYREYWSRADCTSVATMSSDFAGNTCWQISGVDCVDR